ncbi:uncharacterized protein V6R79_005894 [Siganus canaliculatus]
MELTKMGDTSYQDHGHSYDQCRYYYSDEEYSYDHYSDEEYSYDQYSDEEYGHDQYRHDQNSHDQYDYQYPAADIEIIYLQNIIDCGWGQYCKVVEDLRMVSAEKFEWTLERQKLFRAEKRCQRKLRRLQDLFEQKEAALKDQNSKISDLEQEVRVLAEENKSCKKTNANLGSCLRRKRETMKELELQLADKNSDSLSLQCQLGHLTKKQGELAEVNQELICSEKSWQNKAQVLQEIIIQRSTSFASQVLEMSCKESALLLKCERLQEDSQQEKEKWEKEKNELEARCLQLEAIMADKEAMKKEIRRREEEDKKKKKQDEEEMKKRVKEDKKKKKQEEEEMKKREKEEGKKEQ